MTKYIANSEGQDLETHCKAVGIITGLLLKELGQPEEIQNCGILAGYLHDTGKANPDFQKFITTPLEESDDSNPPKFWHNQENVAYFLKNKAETFNRKYAYSLHAVYFHHSPARNSMEAEDIEYTKDVEEFSKRMFKEWERLGLKCKSGKGEYILDPIPKDDCKYLIIRLCLITADRWVSEIGASLNEVSLDLDGAFCQRLADYRNKIKTCSNFEIQNLRDYQLKAVDSIKNSSSNTFELKGPAGCGKTIISLAFLELFGKQRSFFISPTNEVGISLFNTIQDDLSTAGIKKNDIELITASKRQNYKLINGDDTSKEFESDVVISNIDSVLTAMFYNHSLLAKIGMDLLTQPMVFDEFHLLNQNNAILHLFRSLVTARDYLGSKTLLISATPLPLFPINGDIKPAKISVGFEGKMKDLDTEHEFTTEEFESDDVFYRTNTIKECQEDFKGSDFIYHAQYADEHRKLKAQMLIEEKGRGGYSKNNMKLSTSSVLECSINISFKDGAIYLSSPESLIQTLGRVMRFGQNGKSKVWLKTKLDKGSGALIREAYNKDLHEAFVGWCKANIIGKTLKKSEVYEIVEDFNKKNRQAIESYIKENIGKSIKASKEIKQKSFKKNNDANTKVSSGGIRGGGGYFCVFNVTIGGRLNILECNISDSKYDDISDVIGYNNGRLILDLAEKVTTNIGGQAKLTNNYKIKFNPKKSNKNRQVSFSDVGKILMSAKNNNNFIPLQFTDGQVDIRHSNVRYDDNPDLRKNKGIIFE